jgi:hypothetical protein
MPNAQEKPMKPYAFLAAVLALTGACSSSTSDRPSTNDEHHAAMQRDRDEARAEAAEATESDETYEEGASAIDVDRDQAALGSDAREAPEREPSGTSRDDQDERTSRTEQGEAPDNTGRTTATINPAS